MITPPSAKRALRYVTLAVVALGVCLRVRGYVLPGEGNSLWLDEALWAIELIQKPLAQHLIRPIGFMAICKAAVAVFGAHEWVLRALPWAAGIATTLMARPIAERLFASEAARLLFVSVIALHPAAIDLSKEFKPYSAGLAVHAAMLLFALRYRDSGSRRDLIVAATVTALSVTFAQDALFAYPGVFLLLAITAWRARRTRHVIGVVAAGAAALALVAGMYFFVWSRLEQRSESRYWGRKYDVFYVKRTNPEGKVDWFLRRYAGLAELPGERRDLWPEALPQRAALDVPRVDRAAWLVLHVAGLTLLSRGLLVGEGLLLALPLATMSAFNLLGFWPFGVFRANLFALLYVTGIAAAAVDRRPRRVSYWDLVPALVLVLLPLGTLERTWHRRKETLAMTSPSAFRTALQQLLDARLRAGRTPPTSAVRPPPDARELVVVDHWSCHPARFYVSYHPGTKETLGAEIERRFRFSDCLGNPKKVFGALRDELSHGGRAWLLVSSQAVMDSVERQWPDDLEKAVLERVEGGLHLIVGVRRAPRGSSASATPHATDDPDVGDGEADDVEAPAAAGVREQGSR